LRGGVVKNELGDRLSGGILLEDEERLAQLPQRRQRRIAMM